MSATGRPFVTSARRTALPLGRRSGRPSASSTTVPASAPTGMASRTLPTSVACTTSRRSTTTASPTAPARRIRRGTNGASTTNEAAHTAMPTSPDVSEVVMPSLGRELVHDRTGLSTIQRPQHEGHCGDRQHVGEQHVPEQSEATSGQRHDRDDAEDHEADPLQPALHDPVHRRGEAVDELGGVTFERQDLALDADEQRHRRRYEDHQHDTGGAGRSASGGSRGRSLRWRCLDPTAPTSAFRD